MSLQTSREVIKLNPNCTHSCPTESLGFGSKVRVDMEEAMTKAFCSIFRPHMVPAHDASTENSPPYNRVKVTHSVETTFELGSLLGVWIREGGSLATSTAPAGPVTTGGVAGAPSGPLGGSVYSRRAVLHFSVHFFPLDNFDLQWTDCTVVLQACAPRFLFH